MPPQHPPTTQNTGAQLGSGEKEEAALRDRIATLDTEKTALLDYVQESAMKKAELEEDQKRLQDAKQNLEGQVDQTSAELATVKNELAGSREAQLADEERHERALDDARAEYQGMVQLRDQIDSGRSEALDNLRQLEQDLEAKATENREMAAIQNELLTSIRSKSTELDSARDTARQLQVWLAACVCSFEC
jgi:chromosome segregation ATPase